MPSGKPTTILVTHPIVAKDWDVERNKLLKIEDIGPSNKREVWWLCKNRHSYAISAFTRIRTNGCKYCNKEINKEKYRSARIKKGTSIAISEIPEFLSIWDYASNNFSPNEITSSSNVVISWKCLCGNSWKMSPKSILKRKSDEIRYQCIDCVDKKINQISLNSRRKNTKLLLKDVMPQLRESWDSEKNDISFDMAFPVGNKKYWWKCHFGHSWDASPQNRNIAQSGCPECSGIGTSKIEIYLLCELKKIFAIVDWRKKIDSFEIDIFLPEYSIGIEVDGEYWHRNKFEKDRKKSAYLKSKGIHLIRIRSNYLTETDDHMIIIKAKSNIDDFQNITNNVVDYLKKKISAPELRAYSLNKKQVASSEYQEMIARLPAPPEGDSLMAIFPDVAAEWDYVKNTPLTPDLFAPKSDQKFWWICSNKHSWQAVIKNRTLNGSNCPECHGENLSAATKQRHLIILGSINDKYPQLIPFWDSEANEIESSNVSSNIHITYKWKCHKGHKFTRMLKSMLKDYECPICNSINNTHPELMSEWDRDKNKLIDPSIVSKGSGKLVWWRCQNNHSWSASPARRIYDNSTCPTCNSLGFKYPNLLKEWIYEKNSGLDPMHIHPGTHTKAWWNCPNKHEWQTSIYRRTRDGMNCPQCRKSFKKIEP